jgi:hypothetical protein
MMEFWRRLLSRIFQRWTLYRQWQDGRAEWPPHPTATG